MNTKDTSETNMIFAPSFTRKRRIQLRLSERRLVMIAGDILAIVLSVFMSLAIWAYVGQIAYDMSFIMSQSMWFFILAGLWTLLANANGYYDFSIASDLWASVQRLVLITGQLVIIYVFMFFFAERGTLPRLFIFYYSIISFGLMFLWRLFNTHWLGKC